MKLTLPSSVVLVASLIAGCPGDPMASLDTGGVLDAPATDGGGDDGGAIDAGSFDGGDRDGGGEIVDGGSDGGDLDGGMSTVDGGTGCASNGDCSRAQYCATEPGMCDTNGVCMPRPFSCPDLFDPVCGCDGADYGNACDAASVGVNVATRGMCAAATCDLRPRATCCFLDSACGRGQHCVQETCAAGGEGTCEPTPASGACWEDRDCGLGGTCVSARICPCGADCFAPDAPGTCAFAG